MCARCELGRISQVLQLGLRPAAFLARGIEKPELSADICQPPGCCHPCITPGNKKTAGGLNGICLKICGIKGLVPRNEDDGMAVSYLVWKSF